MHERVLVPEFPRVIVVGERVHVRPVPGETPLVRVTVPVNPWTFVTNTVEVPADPALATTLAGLSVTEKS